MATVPPPAAIPAKKKKASAPPPANVLTVPAKKPTPKPTSMIPLIVAGGAGLLVCFLVILALGVVTLMYFKTGSSQPVQVTPSTSAEKTGKVSPSGFSMKCATTNHGKDLTVPKSTPQNIWTVDVVVRGKFSQSDELRLVLMDPGGTPKVLTVPKSTPQNIWTVDVVVRGKFSQSDELRLVLMDPGGTPKVLTYIAEEQIFGGKAELKELTFGVPPNSKSGYELVLVDRTEKVLCREPIKLQ